MRAVARHTYRDEVLIPEVEANLDYTRQVSGGRTQAINN